MSVNLNNLKESNEFLNNLLDNITSAIFILNKDKQIMNFNNSFQALFNIEEQEAIGKLSGNVLGCAFAVEEGRLCGSTSHCEMCMLRKSVLNAFANNLPVYRQKLYREFYISNNKIEKHFLFSTRVIHFNNQEVALIIVDDVSEIEKQKNQLEFQNAELKQLNEQKNRFLGIAAHDLRNPLGIIRMYTEFMIEEHTSNEQHTKFLDRISKSSLFMIRLLNDLLDISKIESGKLELIIEEYDYAEFVKNNVELNNVFAERKDIKLSLDVPEKLILKFDEQKITQVLNNLISNAIKFSHSGTEIKIVVEKEEKYITTKIIDQGQGIPADEIEHLFKEFRKTSVKATAGERSTGLGLAIVKKIVEGHRGEIGVESETGKGSTFFFRLPF